ncbi:MAG TPA: YraN family protein [Syntrophales bacterium]|nr:YraN family protein [Syntrophales bacterium]
MAVNPRGKDGEDLASAYLKRIGYKILERNYRCALGEIDIVARDGPVLVFVEVKSQRTARFGTPQESVNPSKQRKISLIALWFLKEKRLDDVPARFDVLGIRLGSGGPKFELVRNAFDLAVWQ